MAFCPECNFEYKKGIKICPECKVKLVDELTEPEHEERKIEWVALHTQPGRIYSEMVKEALEKNNIPCVLEPGNISALGGKGISLVGDESKLWVPVEHFEEAQNIMDQMIDHI